MVEWVLSNWELVVAALGAVVIAGKAIAKLTPTPADDVFWAKLHAALKKVTFTK